MSIDTDNVLAPGAGPAAKAALPARLRRRRRLLLLSAPGLLAVAVLAVKLLSLPIAAGQAADSFAGGNAAGTVKAGQAMGTLNLVERYKAHFALGDGHVLQGDFDKARDEFTVALELAPFDESCRVRVNLVLSLEKLGAAKEQGGDTASAAKLYAEGSGLVAAAPRDCFAPNSPNNSDGEGESLKQAGERLAQKQKGDGDGGQQQPSDGDAGADAPEPPADKLKQLEQQGQQAQKERSQGQKLKEALSEEEPEQYAKPW